MKRGIKSSAMLMGLAMLAFAFGPASWQSRAEDFYISVPATKGGTARAACHAGGAGNWTFVVSSVSGKLSRVSVQIYTGSRPDGTGQICDPHLGDCNGTASEFVKVGEITFSKPKAGDAQVISLAAGAYCIRVVTVGTGTVTVTGSHP